MRNSSVDKSSSVRVYVIRVRLIDESLNDDIARLVVVQLSQMLVTVTPTEINCRWMYV